MNPFDPPDYHAKARAVMRRLSKRHGALTFAQEDVDALARFARDVWGEGFLAGTAKEVGPEVAKMLRELANTLDPPEESQVKL